MTTGTVTHSQTLADAVREAQERGNELGRGMTIQTRMCVAAMTWLGVPRADYRARTRKDRRRGLYGPASVDASTREAHALIREHATELADAGFHVAVIDGTGSAWISTGLGIEPRVTHIIDGTLVEVYRP